MNACTPRSIDFDSVADLYDDYVRTDFDIPFWLDAGKAAAGKVLELGCGTGRISIPLLTEAVNLTCVDYSPGMLARLRMKMQERNLSCPVYCQDMAELDLPDQFDLIFIAFHSFSEIVDSRRQRLALERIRTHLAPQGNFICTLQNPPVRITTMDGTFRLIGEFSTEEGRKLLVTGRLTYDPSTRRASGEQVYERFSQEGALLDRRVLSVRFRLFPRDEFESLAVESGFSVKGVYGGYDRSPFEAATSPFMIWKLRHPSTT